MCAEFAYMQICSRESSFRLQIGNLKRQFLTENAILKPLPIRVCRPSQQFKIAAYPVWYLPCDDHFIYPGFQFIQHEIWLGDIIMAEPHLIHQVCRLLVQVLHLSLEAPKGGQELLRVMVSGRGLRRNASTLKSKQQEITTHKKYMKLSKIN